MSSQAGEIERREIDCAHCRKKTLAAWKRDDTLADYDIKIPPAICVVQGCVPAKFLAHTGAMFSGSVNLHGQKIRSRSNGKITNIIAKLQS